LQTRINNVITTKSIVNEAKLGLNFSEAAAGGFASNYNGLIVITLFILTLTLGTSPIVSRQGLRVRVIKKWLWF